MRKFRLIATGGTIASRRSAAGLLAGVSGRELLEASGLGDLDVEVEDLQTVGSYAFAPADLLELARHVRKALSEGVDGVVITHGTDTMEETAFLLDLVHDDERPVVLTGAQRSFDSDAPDGPANLAAAFAVAAAPEAQGLGPLLVFDGRAWQARGVRKIETLAAGAFGAPGRGPALRITPTGVLAVAAHTRPAAFVLDQVVDLPRVDVLAAYVGADAALVDAVVAAGARGVVLQALGAGNASPRVTEALIALLEQNLPVVVSTRVPSGPVAPLYTAGGGADLARAGAVFSGDLSPWQARLLASVALAVRPEGASAVIRSWLRESATGARGAGWSSTS